MSSLLENDRNDLWPLVRSAPVSSSWRTIEGDESGRRLAKTANPREPQLLPREFVARAYQLARRGHASRDLGRRHGEDKTAVRRGVALCERVWHQRANSR